MKNEEQKNCKSIHSSTHKVALGKEQHLPKVSGDGRRRPNLDSRGEVAFTDLWENAVVVAREHSRRRRPAAARDGQQRTEGRRRLGEKASVVCKIRIRTPDAGDGRN